MKSFPPFEQYYSNLKRLLLILPVFVFVCFRAFAMPPPEPGEMEKYRLDGTLEQRLRYADEMGNDRMSPFLARKADMKLRRALGLPAPLLRPPPGSVGMPTTGTDNIVVLCISFPEYPATYATSTIESELFAPGNPLDEDFPYESLAGYYYRSSYGQLTIQGNVLGWHTTAYNRADAPLEQEIIREAVEYYDQQGHDFSQYDNDGDGFVDYMLIVWTGPHTGWGSKWWAHQSVFLDETFTVDGKKLKTYSWNWESQYPEGGSPGLFDTHVTIHETGHALGLPDYYDYKSRAEGDEIGPDGGVGNLDMMDGNWGDHNAFSKFVLDWIEPTVYTSSATISLGQSDINKDAAIIMPEATQGEVFSEYFVIQNRERSGNDLKFPADGLTIWHVDATLDSEGYDYVFNNSRTAHKLLRLMEADGLEEIEQNGRADAGDFYTIGDELSDATTPDTKRYDGSSTGMVVSDISPSGATMSVVVSFDNTPPADIAFVNDGEADDIDVINSNMALSANWATSTDVESRVAGYWIAIGTTPGATDVVDWTSNGTAASATVQLSEKTVDGQMYYFSVAAKNGAGLFSSVATSDGVLVDVFDVVSIQQIDEYSLDVLYNRDVDGGTATDTANYSIDNGAGVPVSATLLQDNRTVRLVAAEPLRECVEYAATIQNVTADGDALFVAGLPVSVSIIGSIVRQDINSDTTWTKSGSPYCVLTDVSLYKTAKLTVQAGATIKFWPDAADADLGTADRADLIISGGFFVEGSKDDPVVIESASATPAPGDWGALMFYDAESWTGKISYADIRHAANAVNIAESNAILENSSFSDCKFDCVFIQAGSPIIRRNTFSGCPAGGHCLKTISTDPVIVRDNYFAPATNSVSLFSKTEFVGNSIEGATETALGIVTGSDDSTVKENNFMNAGTGIFSWLENGDTDATHNYFSNNTQDAKTDCQVNGCTLDASYPLAKKIDPKFAPSSLMIVTNAYAEYTGPSIYPGSYIYFKLQGTDADSSTVNSSVARLVNMAGSATDAIYVALSETGPATGVYQGSAKLDVATDQSLGRIGAEIGDTLKIYSLRDETLQDTVFVDNDHTPPTNVSKVFDGLSTLTANEVDVISVLDRLEANWTASTDGESGVKTYWYSVGTSPGIANVVDWTDNGMLRSITRTGLSLSIGETYYFSVKAENNEGLFSTPTSSDGQTVVKDVIHIGAGWNLAGISKSNASFNMAPLYATGTYQVLSFSSGSGYFEATGATTTIGVGYWIYSSEDDIDIPVKTTSGGAAFSQLTLPEGWSVFSIPGENKLEWGAADFNIACGESTEFPDVYSYNNQTATYTKLAPDAGSFLFPWMAYWINAASECVLTLK